MKVTSWSENPFRSCIFDEITVVVFFGANELIFFGFGHFKSLSFRLPILRFDRRREIMQGIDFKIEPEKKN